MDGKLVPERSYVNDLQYTGRMVCVSCSLWNCWHQRGQPCDIRGCECTLGNDSGGSYVREPRTPKNPTPKEELCLNS